MRPTPPLARAAKYSIILALGLPVSSAMQMLPMGPMTMRLRMWTELTWMGANRWVYGCRSADILPRRRFSSSANQSPWLFTSRWRASS